MICDTFFEKSEYLIYDILKLCKNNEHVLQFLLKYTKNVIIKIGLKGEFYSRVVMIWSSI